MFEKWFEFYLESLVTEGKRFSKIKTLTFVLYLIGSLRRIAVNCFVVFVNCLLLTASLFGGLSYNLKTPTIELDTLNIVLLLIGSSSMIFLLWSLQEQRWLNAFEISSQIKQLSEISKDSTPNKIESPLNQSELESLISKLIDIKLQKQSL